MGIFRKKAEPPIANPVVPEQYASNNDYEEEVEQPIQPQVQTPQPIIQKPVQQPAQPQQSEITEDILRQILAEFEMRISNIEARLFRRGL